MSTSYLVQTPLQGMDPCYICLEEISEEGKPALRSPCMCRAAVHYGCMRIWLQTSETSICPNCRGELEHTFGAVFAAPRQMELEEMEQDVACCRRFLHLTRILGALLSFYTCLLFGFANAGSKHSQDALMFSVLLLGPVVGMWLLCLVYLVCVEIKRCCCTQPAQQQIVPNDDLELNI